MPKKKKKYDIATILQEGRLIHSFPIEPGSYETARGLIMELKDESRHIVVIQGKELRLASPIEFFEQLALHQQHLNDIELAMQMYHRLPGEVH